MANAGPKTLQEIQDQINTLVANDADTPTTDDEEWDTRLNLIKTAIGNWGMTQDILWQELWKTYTHGSTVSASRTYSLSITDYRFKGKKKKIYITLNNQENDIPWIDPSESDTYEDAGIKAGYITGNQQDGFVLNLTWLPADGDGYFGGTIVFEYYKYPFVPAATTDKVEMPNSNYIIFWVAAIKSLLESQNNKYAVFDGQATEAMENMIALNDPEGKVEDTDAINGAVLGE